MYAPALDTYRRQQVDTASPMQLVRMLYDAMLESTREAKAALTERDYERVHHRLLHAQRIVEELDHALDIERGGDIAGNLRRLYDFLIQRLTYVNITKSVSALEDTEAVMEEMHAMWSGVPGWD
ncbi:MAG: flagellar export chaperone FliS [Armatimonadetes bacterium]|nr:flagellar export chaperone FliS [Armatimonadota bacterium]